MKLLQKKRVKGLKYQRVHFIGLSNDRMFPKGYCVKGYIPKYVNNL